MNDSIINNEEIDGLGKKLLSKILLISVTCLIISWIPYLFSFKSLKFDLEFYGDFLLTIATYTLCISFGLFGYYYLRRKMIIFLSDPGHSEEAERQFIFHHTIVGMLIIATGLVLATLASIYIGPNDSVWFPMIVSSCLVIHLGYQMSQQFFPCVESRDPIQFLNFVYLIFIVGSIILYSIFIIYPTFRMIFFETFLGSYTHLNHVVLAICGIITAAPLFISKMDTNRVAATFKKEGKILLESPSKPEVVKALASFLFLRICLIIMMVGYLLTGYHTIMHIFVPATILMTMYIRSTVNEEKKDD